MGLRPLLASAPLLLLLLWTAAPSHADSSLCRSVWLFKLPCSEPARTLANQVRAWSTKECRVGRERCKYEIIKESPGYLEVKHTSPDTQKTTELNFKFNPPAAASFCRILSTAKSRDGTGPNDYCLLSDLLNGSGLAQAEGYKEICNVAMCPSKGEAPCAAATWARDWA